MNSRLRCRQGRAAPTRQRGTAALEFALISVAFFSLLIGIMEMGRVMFYWNTAAEATRLGARVAVVCDIDSPAIKTKMETMLSILQDGNIDVTYSPPGCDVASCTDVTVSIVNVTVDTLIPFVPISIAMPSFATTLPRESLDSVNGTNPTCS